MADTGQSTQRSDRPLSPHLTIYRPQFNSIMSILHRITGAGLGLTGMLLVWWFLAAATSPVYFEFIDGLLTSWLGLIVLTVSLWAFWYHFFNGVRHLRWDLVKGLGIGQSLRTGWYVLILSVLFTIFSIYLTL
jgi:succinate dehydrogenase cytochrome b subunit